MAESSQSSQTSVQYDYSIKFIKKCADEFQWKDLSEDVVMDIGCGHELNCCKAIMTQFPEVKALIAVDHNSTVFKKAQFRDTKIQFVVGDIRNRESLESHEGKMDKVISTNIFHHILDKETAFRNVYHLLKPGGEAGFSFVVGSSTHKFLTVLAEIPKYAAYLKGVSKRNPYPPEHRQQYYKEMLEKIGFKHVRAVEEERRVPFNTDARYEDTYFGRLEIMHQISPEGTEEFKEEALLLYERTFGRYEGKLCLITVELNLLGVKPKGRSASKTKKTTVA
ncbi:jhamt [Trichonephila clavata]|uniref:Jhamt n=1 Tax=Trichonephila clavata TaxID=2740835 RepID=A0A8X6IK00_TRICU|nr:jhamt [Trichonephila clavata]